MYTVYMSFDFVLSQNDKRAMYLQIMDQIEQRISVGDWPPGTKLPSIRLLATSIKVSIITVKRAYLELERDGIIVTQQGKGSWINETLDVHKLQREELERHLEQAGKLAKSLSIPSSELVTMLTKYAK